MEIFTTVNGDVLLYFLAAALILSIIFVFVFNRRMMKESTGNKKMVNLAELISKGAMQFLRTEYLYVAVFVVIVGVVLAMLPKLGKITAVWFVVGAISSGFAGWYGMNRAVKANVRSTNAAKRSLNDALKVSFSAGSSVGLLLVSIGLIGLIAISLMYLGDHKILEQALIGYAFGVASIALFARVGGGIFTKAADVGADLVGKIEAGIPEDDPRNPAVIADNVGDNVGDTAGMGADLFDSLIVNSVAAMTIGLGVAVTDVQVAPTVEMSAFFFPLFVIAAGLIASILGTYMTRTSSDDPAKALRNGFITTCVVLVGLVAWMSPYFFGNWNIFYTVLIGVFAGIFLGKITEYYTSYDFKHVKGIAESSKTGAATNIIHGLSVGMKSTFGVVATLMVAIYFSYMFAGVYGVAMAGVGMLSLAAIIMAIDVYGPIVDNAGGLAEMAGLDKKVRERTDKLDSAGNTTAAIGKGFAIGSAALAALALLQLFVTEAGISGINILSVNVLIGLFIGALVPYIFSSYIMLAVGNAAGDIVIEVRRQFKSIKGIMEGKAQPEYEKCIKIATKSALKEMIMPSLLVIATPIIVGLTLGAEALGGALGGTLVSGILLGIQQSNSGGAWDNAKKYIEKGNLGGKGSSAHHAAVVGDTVGDPYKDSSGPALNILIKLTILVATVFVVFF
jgi:K(+)-stimulated pyrophosphate-energized sodium pump